VQSKGQMSCIYRRVIHDRSTDPGEDLQMSSKSFNMPPCLWAHLITDAFPGVGPDEQKALCFIVIIPSWEHTMGWRALLNSPFCTDSGEHLLCVSDYSVKNRPKMDLNMGPFLPNNRKRIVCRPILQFNLTPVVSSNPSIYPPFLGILMTSSFPGVLRVCIYPVKIDPYIQVYFRFISYRIYANAL